MDQEEIDKEQLLQYLRGEIPFEQWVQGQQIFELERQFTLNLDVPAASQRQDDKRDEEDDEDDEDDEDHDGGSDDGKTEEAGSSRDPESSFTMLQSRAMETEDSSTGDDGENFQARPGDNAMNIEIQLMRGLRKRKGRIPPGELHKHRRRRTKVPKGLRGLMGQAHLCFARKEHDQATKMCMEIIRQAPRSVEPFQLLGMIYEDQGDMEKSMQFQLIAAHVSPRDTEQWQQLAEVCTDRNDLQKAVYCYTKVLRVKQNHIPTLHARASLYTRLGENKRAMESYHTIIKNLPDEEWMQSIQLARELVQRCHKLGEVNLAIEAMETLVKKYPEHISSEEVNNLAELYISGRQYQRAIQVMCDHCAVEVEFGKTVMQGGQPEAVSVHIPEGLPIDLRVKLAICLIHSRHLTPVSMVTKPLFSEDPEEMGDLYLDVAEAYLEINDYKEAKPILAALVAAKNYNLPAVWLRFAECLNSLGELAESSKAYSEVLKQAPRHLDARLALAAIEQQLGRAESALQTLTLDPIEQDDDQALSKQDIQLLFRQSTLMHTQGHLQEFVEKGLDLLYKYILSKYIQKDQEDHANFSVITKGEWFGLIQKTSQSLGDMKRYGDACKLIKETLDSNVFERETDKLKKLKFMLVCASYLHNNFEEAFHYIRDFVSKWGEKTNLMNLFSLVVTNTMGPRHHKFCLRLTIKFYPDSTILSIINGHNALQTSSYKHAIGEYVRAYYHNPSNPFMLMCVGVCLFALATQRFTVNKDSIITQGFSCLRSYQRLRGDTQETNYNIGRALQQVSIDHLAIHYYHKGLGLLPIIPHDNRFDLRPQIAFNLSIIYRQNGNLEMAQELLETFCVI